MKSGKKQRYFSEAFKIEKVRMLESKQITVLQLSRIYEVSTQSIYKWLLKYSVISKSERVVVEKESEGAKTIALLNTVATLERKVGQKQLLVDYLEKVIELASEEVGYDIKKKFALRSSDGLEHTGEKKG